MKGKDVVMIVGLCMAGVIGWRAASAPALAAGAMAMPTVATDLSSIRRGAELAALGDCIVCHTAKGGNPFAGGLPMV